MTTFLLFVAVSASSFALGYWIALHPTDTRTFLQRVRDAVGRLIHRP
jgi:hypothetical protein